VARLPAIICAVVVKAARRVTAAGIGGARVWPLPVSRLALARMVVVVVVVGSTVSTTVSCSTAPLPSVAMPVLGVPVPA
jgi:hypothetical protein